MTDMTKAFPNPFFLKLICLLTMRILFFYVCVSIANV